MKRATIGCLLALILPRVGPANDCNQNGVDDGIDVFQGTSPDCNQNGVPDECDMAPGMAFGPEPLSADPGAQGLLLVDLDSDGDLDLLSAGATDLLVHENLGARRFEPVRITVPREVLPEAAGDLDGDGFPEVLASRDRRQVLSFRSDGTGNLGAPAGLLPDDQGNILAIFLEDLNGDGDLDVLVEEDSKVRIAWNGGDAVFPEETYLAAPSAIGTPAIADLDGDGLPDVAAGESGGIAVHRNLGGHDFESLPAIGPSGPQVLEAVDLDDDGTVDLAAGSPGPWGTTIIIHQNRGGMGFTRRFQALVDPGELWDLRLRALDLDGDGRPDLLLGASISRNLGDLRFQVSDPLPVRGDIRAGDIDGDGAADLAVRTLGEISILWNPGDGRLRIAPGHPVGDGPVAAAAADLDGDGRAEVAVAATGSDEVVVLRVPGNGALETAARVPAGDGPAAIVAADLDGDGRPELAVAALRSDEVIVIGDRGSGSYRTDRFPAGGAEPTSLAAVDLDGDGDLDLALACRLSGTITVLPNDGQGAFGEPRSTAVGGWPVAIAAVGPGLLGGHDLIACDGATLPDLSLIHLAGGGPSGFVVNRPPRGWPPLNDLEVQVGGGAHISAAAWMFLLDPMIEMGKTLHGGPFLPAPLFADLNGNGKPEVVTLEWTPGRIAVRASVFVEGVSVTVDGSPGALAAADVDGDGLLDLIVGDLAGGTVEVILVRPTPPSSQDSNRDGIPDECAGLPRFIRGDANSDGEVDLADAVFLLLFLFGGGPAPGCLAAADAANTGGLNLNSVIVLLEELFHGFPPRPPFSACGFDPFPWGLGCWSYPPCRR